MKKYILGSLLGLFSLVGTFASAENYSFTDGGDEKYSPYTFTTEGGTLYNLNYTCNSNEGETECAMYIIGNGNDNYGQVLCSMVGYDNEMSAGAYNGTPDNLCENGLNVEAGDYRVRYGGYTSLSNVSFSIGEYSGGGNINEDDNNGNIISSGINAFGGIIDKLGNISGEFVPYLLYIGIGILGITLIINAVKYILGYMKGETMNNFNDREGMKERRRRRRRNKRKKKTKKKK